MVNQPYEAQKMEAAATCFEGGALSWLHFEEKRKKFLTWEEFKKIILLRFPRGNSKAMNQRFLSLKQTDSMQEYRE